MNGSIISARDLDISKRVDLLCAFDYPALGYWMGHLHVGQKKAKDIWRYAQKWLLPYDFIMTPQQMLNNLVIHFIIQGRSTKQWVGNIWLGEHCVTMENVLEAERERCNRRSTISKFDCTLAENYFRSQIHGKPEDKRPLHKEPWVLQQYKQFDDKQASYENAKCSICLEYWFTTKKVQDEASYKCDTCKKKYSQTVFKLANEKEQVIYHLSKENDMIPVDFSKESQNIVDLLRSLTEVEKMLCQRVSPMMKIFHLGQRGEIGMSGSCINIAQDINTFAKSLPRKLKDLDIIIVKRPRSQIRSEKSLKVNRKRVLEYLTLLKKRNPYYKDIEINQSLIMELPEDGVPHESYFQIVQNENEVDELRNKSNRNDMSAFPSDYVIPQIIPQKNRKEAVREMLKNALNPTSNDDDATPPPSLPVFRSEEKWNHQYHEVSPPPPPHHHLTSNDYYEVDTSPEAPPPAIFRTRYISFLLFKSIFLKTLWK